MSSKYKIGSMYKVLSIKYEISSTYKVLSIKYGKNAMAAALVSLNTLYLILNTATRGRL